MADLFDWAEGREPGGGSEYPIGIPVDVSQLFEQLSLEVARRGFHRYSSDAILHRIRWHHHIERGHREFKANNNWTSVLARWFLNRHRELPGFFETRASPYWEEDDAA